MPTALFRRRIQAPSLVLLAGLVLTACEPVPDNPTRPGASGPEIALVHGKNCFQNLCFYYDSRRNFVTLRGKEGAPIPASVDVSDGYMTPSEFKTLHRTAALSPSYTID
ncbi:hypothetical protein [Shimia biformata]|uniref:hypothetical protein n=1 Tax=Shimia biformata TaxID=1294299 RepID=UPI0019505DD6|nr:hypothetical protein [Shimia biformata]